MHLPKTILIIDDSLTIRKFVEKALLREDTVDQIHLAHDARLGLELATSIQPDLVLCGYTLSDSNGYELSKQLASNPATAHLPVILMSSSSQQIRQLDLRDTNIDRLLIKPFSTELLVATVNYVLGHWDQKKKVSTPAHGQLVMRGISTGAALCEQLRFIEGQKMTGILRTTSGNRIVHSYCDSGVMMGVSTRQVEHYLAGTPFWLQGHKSNIWKKCEERQRETLSPFLINMVHESVLPMQTAQTLTTIYGHRLSSTVWTEPQVEFEFEQVSLPAFVEFFKLNEQNVEDWILQSLRSLESTQSWTPFLSDLDGFPVFTPIGFEKLSQVSPLPEEWKILSLVTGDTSLRQICRKSRVPPLFAAQVIYRFKVLGYLDFWPSRLLQTPS